MTLFIGIGHTSRCGKDTFANALVASLNERGVSAKKISFAWKMKKIAYELYAWAGVKEPEHYETPEGEKDRELKLLLLASELWPEGPTVVDLWVAIGTPAFRESVYPRTWVDYVLKSDHGVEVVVISDVRFPNEVNAIRDEEGYLFRVVRQGFPGRATVADAALRGGAWANQTLGADSVDGLKAIANDMATQISRGEVPRVDWQLSDLWSDVYYRDLRGAGYA